MRVSGIAAAGAALAVLALAGCGIEPPEPDFQAASEPTAEEMPEPGALPAVPSRGPEAALRRVARARGNWTSSTIGRAFRRARAASTGRARAQLRREARETQRGVAGTPLELQSRTTVEAITLPASGASRRALVVTREAITGGGAGDEGYQYRVTLATVERHEGGWLVSSWEPQP